MRKTVGYFTLLAAVVLVVCSAATLFWSAYGGATDPWVKWVQGTQIVCVIIWEAGALVAISYCARHPFPGRSVVVIGGSVLLLLAMGYTLNQELKQQAGAQESASTVREAQSGKLELVRSELDKAIARRDALQKMPKLSIAQQNELATVRREISSLKDKWEAQIEAPHAALAPGVALIARWTGLNINDSADLDPLIKMAFWTMARVFALPLALFAISLMGASTLPVQAREAKKGTEVAPIASSALLTRTARSEMGKHPLLRKAMAAAPNRTENSYTSPDEPPPPPADVMPVAGDPGNGSGGGGGHVKVPGPVLVTQDWKPEPKPKNKTRRLMREETVDLYTKRWLATGQAVPCRLSLGSQGIDVYNAYSAFCADLCAKALNPSHFGRSLKRLGVAKTNKASGVRYGLRLVKQEQRRAAA